jgi:thymidylate synthase ThyX
MSQPKASRVLTIAPMPPEKAAYALARYSRSPDSIKDSIEWVRTHNSEKFLESFYFQYGHASIADLGHLTVCFEGISELAATEVEDEQVWDGQARSSRYQDFSRSGFITPPDLDTAQAKRYLEAGKALLKAYGEVHERMVEYYTDKLPRPDDMKPDAYRRNIAARAFDVARYFLFLGIPTGIGQVVSIRTLERQIRRLKASEFLELRDLADEIAVACAAEPACLWDQSASEPIAPTLARHVDADTHSSAARSDLRLWAKQNLSSIQVGGADSIDLLRPTHIPADIVATLLYSATNLPYRTLYELAAGWSSAQRDEVIDVALRSRERRDELLRSFRGGLYVYDIVMDIGAYRDMHRHRRCQQFRQDYTSELGYDIPQVAADAGLSDLFARVLDGNARALCELPQPSAQYLLPFASRSRFLFKMDFAEAEYICRLRTGVKGHFSYRNVAWLMKEKLVELEPELARVLSATPPWVEDPLKR